MQNIYIKQFLHTHASVSVYQDSPTNFIIQLKATS